MTILTKYLALPAFLSAFMASGALAQQHPVEPANLRGLTPAQKTQVILNSIPNVHFSNSMPTNFPIPNYTSNVTKTNFSNSTSGSPTAAATIRTKDTPATVFAWYQDNCRKAGWQVEAPTTQETDKLAKKGHLSMLKAEKGKQQIFVYCIQDPKSTGTIISISFSITR